MCRFCSTVEWLGEHTESGPQVVASDGGDEILLAGDNGLEESTQSEPADFDHGESTGVQDL